MSLWEERAARNEALFREVNERVASLATGAGDDEIGLVCECSDDGCVERLHLTRGDYEAIRANPRTFVVAPGHEGSFERVLERRARYAVVEKHGEAGRIAERHDPRT
jgi:hypothetical protein